MTARHAFLHSSILCKQVDFCLTVQTDETEKNNYAEEDVLTFNEMDDSVFEQILEKISPSSGSCSPVATMNCSSPQVSSPCSHIYAHETLDGLSSTSSLSPTSMPCTPTESLPPISQFSSSISSSFQQIYAANHEILSPKHGQANMSMDSHIAANMFDLNGNIPEHHSAGHNFSDYHDQEYDENYYPYGNNYYTTDSCVYSMPTSNHVGMHEAQTCQWYGTQASYESDDSFEVENTDHVFPGTIQRPPQFGQIRNTQHTDESSRLPHISVFTAELKKVPNRRGRPVTYNKPGYNYSDSESLHSDEDERSAHSKGCRRGAKNILLWKFLLGELRKPNSNHIKWENEREGVFKFVDTAECSRLWGQMKKKEDMNFEKLSRGIRHYYKDGLMSRRDGIRLVYKFNWDRVPRAFWPRRH